MKKSPKTNTQSLTSNYFSVFEKKIKSRSVLKKLENGKLVPLGDNHLKPVSNVKKIHHKELIEILEFIDDHLLEIENSQKIAKKNIPTEHAAHLKNVRTELQKVKNKLQTEDDGTALMKGFISEMFLFFTGQCDKYSRSLFNLKKQDPIIDVLNKNKNDIRYHYPRTIGLIFRSFLENGHSDIILIKLGIDLRKGLSRFNLNKLDVIKHKKLKI